MSTRRILDKAIKIADDGRLVMTNTSYLKAREYFKKKYGDKLKTKTSVGPTVWLEMYKVGREEVGYFAETKTNGQVFTGTNGNVYEY